MSLNGVMDQSWLPEVQAVLRTVETYIFSWRSASTLEERLYIESLAIAKINELLDFTFELPEVQAGQTPSARELGEVYEEYTFMIRVCNAKIEKLAELFLKHFNSQNIALLELSGKLKRVKQKQAVLDIWGTDNAKYVFGERFFNLDAINNTYVSLEECNVDTDQGVLTLPIKTTESVTITNAYVGAGSNGQPGNSDSEITFNNINPVFAINADSNNWFEYERLHRGPCKLTYVVELPKSEIVNHVAVEALNLGESYGFEIDDIIFSDESSVSIKSLISGGFNKDFFTVKANSTSNQWAVTFVPTTAKTITFKFSQRNKYAIPVTTTDDREIFVDRFAIALKSVEVKRHEFSVEGGIGSLMQTIPSGLYAGIPFANVWPPSPKLFDAHLELSFDGGETWANNDNLDDGLGSDFLIDGTETNVLWRLALRRDDIALDNAVDFVESASTVKSIDTTLRTVSRFQSPATIPLANQPRNNEVFVMQPKLGRRGDRFNTIRLGEVTGTVTTFELPFNPIAQNVQPEDLNLYVNKSAFAYNADADSLTTGEWGFTDDFREVKVSSSATGAEVTLVINPEEMTFEQESDGYYHTMQMLFDPDKDNIDIYALAKKAGRATVLLPRDKTIIYLGHQYINSDSFTITAANTTFTEQAAKADLATKTDYYVDYVNGIVQLGGELDSVVASAVFEHSTPIKLAKTAYSIWFDGIKPGGIRINPDAFQAKTHVDTIAAGAANEKVINPGTGRYARRNNPFGLSPKSQTLSYGNIVKNSVRVSSDLLGGTVTPEEVEFIDGTSEFLGLIPVESESTVQTVAAADNVSFTLAAGAAVYLDAGVDFSNKTVFSTKETLVSGVTTTGDYHISDEGVVTVYIGTGNTLPGGIKINYSYRNPSFDPSNKFSIDYHQGHIHAFVNLNTDATVKYKTANYAISYDIAKEMPTYKYNRQTNSVSIRTERLHSINNLVKIVWEETPEVSKTKQMKKFFSPLISVLAFRMF